LVDDPRSPPGPFAVVWWSLDGSKAETPNVEFVMCKTFEEAMETRKETVEESWEDACLDENLAPIKPEDVFIRPVVVDSGSPDFSDAEWVVIEIDSTAHDEQLALSMFHSYNSLGSVPAEILMRLCKGSPRFLLAYYVADVTGFTLGAFELAAPILRNLQILIGRLTRPKD
jgi:hypothetical protein